MARRTKKCKWGRRTKGKCPRKKTRSTVRRAAPKRRSAAARHASYEKGLQTEFENFARRYPSTFTEQDARDFINSTPSSITQNRDGSITNDDTGETFRGLGSTVRRSYTTQQRLVDNRWGGSLPVYDIVDNRGTVVETSLTYDDAYRRAIALTQGNTFKRYDDSDAAARAERQRERNAAYVAPDEWDF